MAQKSKSKSISQSKIGFLEREREIDLENEGGKSGFLNIYICREDGAHCAHYLLARIWIS